MPYHGGSHSSDYHASEDDTSSLPRSEHPSEFKILIQTALSEEPVTDNLLSSSSGGATPCHKSRRLLVLLACTIVGFVMNVLVSVVAPFFPQEAKRLTGTSNTVIGFIFAIFPLTSLVVSPLINMSIRRLGRKWTLCLGLLMLSFSTIGFGLSRTIALWCATRILQGAGSAAAGATYYAILSDMYPENLGFVIGIQEAVTGLGYMVGPMLGAALFSLGGFRVPFLALGAFPLAVCVMLPPLLRDAHNFEPSHNIPYGSPTLFAHDPQEEEEEVGEEDEDGGLIASSSNLDEKMPVLDLGGGSDLQQPQEEEEEEAYSPQRRWRRRRRRASKKSSPFLSFPFLYVALGTTLATCGFAFLEPVLSEHLMKQLHVTTSVSGLLMGVPSITYIVAAPLGGWLGEVCGYRPILFLGFLIFAMGLALVGPLPLLPDGMGSSLQWTVQVGALAMLGLGSAFGTITTMPDLRHIAGPGTTDEVACIFNNILVPAGEVLGPLVGGFFTQLLGFQWAAFYFGCLLLAYGLALLLMHLLGVMTWAHHRDEDNTAEAQGSDDASSYLLERSLLRVRSDGGIQSASYSSTDDRQDTHIRVVEGGHPYQSLAPEEDEEEVVRRRAEGDGQQEEREPLLGMGELCKKRPLWGASQLPPQQQEETRRPSIEGIRFQ